MPNLAPDLAYNDYIVSQTRLTIHFYYLCFPVSTDLAAGIKSMASFATMMSDAPTVVPTVNPTASTAPFSRRQSKVQFAELRAGPNGG